MLGLLRRFLVESQGSQGKLGGREHGLRRFTEVCFLAPKNFRSRAASTESVSFTYAIAERVRLKGLVE